MIETKIAEYVSLQPYTTYRIGGPARYFLLAESTDEVVDAIHWSRERRVPWFVLGGGSNLLISDQGFPGLVIKLGRGFGKIEIDQEGGAITAGGAVMLPKLGMHLVRQGWAGFEFMCGIPGTVGGAIRMNAGTKNGETKDNLVSVKVITPRGQMETIEKEALGFTYRRSKLFKTQGIVAEATFYLHHTENLADLVHRVRDALAERRRKQPAEKRNCGSVFRNPPGQRSAGWYLERACLKGTRIGDAMVAEEHANWILNLGRATSQDVKALIEVCQHRVFGRFGVSLEKEVMFVPDDVLLLT